MSVERPARHLAAGRFDWETSAVAACYTFWYPKYRMTLKLNTSAGKKAAPKQSPPTDAVGPSVNKSVVLILKSLRCFTRERPSLGVTDLANELGITKNMAFRALSTLLDEGFLVRDSTGHRYELGFGALMFLADSKHDDDIRAVCLRYMPTLQRISGGTVVFSIPMGATAVPIDAIETSGVRLVRTGWIPVPLHVSSGCRAILASLHDEEIAEYIKISRPLKKYTPNTITDPAKLWEDVHLVRKRGYATGFEDRIVGSNYVAFPVFDENRRPHGAITIGGPKEKFSRPRLLELLPRLQEVMARLNSEASLIEASPVAMSQPGLGFYG